MWEPGPIGFLRPNTTLAKKIAVEGEPEALQAHVARRLVSRGLARWKVRGKSIVRCKEREMRLKDIAALRERTAAYVPEKLPLAELPGIKFELPERPPKFPFPVFEDLPAIQD
jgi:hypothetical protein